MMKRIGLCITLIIASTSLLALPAYAQLTQNEIQKLLASDKATGDWFGGSVAIDGDTALVGAFFEDDSGTQSNGAAYVFTRTAGIWAQQDKLLASDKANDDLFGVSVAIDGDTAVIGAIGADVGGAAYVFNRSEGIWTQQAKLLASDKARGDSFGTSVVIDGDTAVIGATGEGDSGTEYNGAAYVFTRTAGIWAQQDKLLASDTAIGDHFGVSVAIDGDTAVIGAIGEDDSGMIRNGAAYVFSRSVGTWTQQAKLLASDKADFDQFGVSVAIDGDTAMIGADRESDRGTRYNGAVYVFTRFGRYLDATGQTAGERQGHR